MDNDKAQELEALLTQSESNLTQLGKDRIEELRRELEQYE